MQTTGTGVRLAATVVCALGLGLSWDSVSAQSQSTSGDQSARPSPEHGGQESHHFAILGAVPRPGAYELPTASPGLVRLVEAAGGLTAEATGQIRVIRNGRGGERVLYSPRSNVRLFPGDVLVVQRRSQRGNRGGSGGAGAGQEVVRVALVHVIDRPVVLPMRPQEASLATIVQSLNQPSDVLWTVTAIAPGFPPTRPGPDSSPEIPLPTDTVLVFDPSALHPERLPGLPGPYRLDSQSGPAHREAAEDSEAAATLPVSGTEQPAPSADGPPAFPAVDRATAGPSTSGDPSSADPDRPADGRAVSAPEPSQQDRDSSGPRTLTQRGPGRPESEPRPSAADTPDWAANIVGLLGGSVTLAAALLLWSMARRATAPVRQSGGSRLENGLEALIRNRLPVVDEPVDPPQGQLVADQPTGRPDLRTDEAHAIQGPHFRKQSLDASAHGQEDAPPPESNERPSPGTAGPGQPFYRVDSAGHRRSAGRTPGTPDRPARRHRPEQTSPGGVQPGPLDRALAAVHGAEIPGRQP